MTVHARYQANYDRIAQAHVAYARDHDGGNPFQDPAQVETLEDATEELVRRYVTPGAQILDAGCGTGSLLARLLDDYPDAAGIDLSNDYVWYARRNVTLNVHCYDVELLSAVWDNEFDAVLCCDVLEHILHPDIAVAELVRVLKPKGYLIIRVPLNEDLSVYTDLAQQYEYVHLRRFDRPSLILWLTKVHDLTILETPIVTCANGWQEIHAVAVKP